MALASTYHWLDNFENALLFYYFTFCMNPTNPGITFRIAQCLVNLSDEAAAMETLRFCISQSYNATEYHEIGLMADKLLTSLL